MNLRDLKYFLALAETAHFGKAAARCHVSQPTLSGQLKKLEEGLGVTLFERTQRSVRLTPIGEEILRHARVLLEQADTIQALADAHRDPLSGPLRIGAIPTLSPYLMPLVLKPLQRDYPQIKLVLYEEIGEALLRRVREHEIDAALLSMPADDPELDRLPLFKEPFWLAHPRNHALYMQDEITREDLENLELLLLADTHCLTGQVLEICHLRERPVPDTLPDLRAASLETLIQLVGAGFGCTLVPALAIRGPWLTDTGVIARPLAVPDACREVALVFRRSFPRRPVLEVFAQVVRDNLPNTVKVAGRT